MTERDDCSEVWRKVADRAAKATLLERAEYLVTAYGLSEETAIDLLEAFVISREMRNVTVEGPLHDFHNARYEYLKGIFEGDYPQSEPDS